MERIDARLKDVESRMETVAFKSVPTRIATFLLQLANEESGKIEGVSHQDLADMVGTYRETVTRILNEFRTKGYIELGRLNVAILDQKALEDIAEE